MHTWRGSVGIPLSDEGSKEAVKSFIKDSSSLFTFG